MRFPRMTIRRMMGVVAVVALIGGAGCEVRRLRRLARIHQGKATIAREDEAKWLALSRSSAMSATMERFKLERALDSPEFFGLSSASALAQRKSQAEEQIRKFDADRARELAIALWCNQIAGIYDRSARYPWLPVEPDPPPPE